MISAAGRKRIAAAQRARWAKTNKQRNGKEAAAHHNYMKSALAEIDAGIAKKKRQLEDVVKLRKVLEMLSKYAI